MGLTGPRASALSVLVFRGPLTMSQLAEAEQVRRPTITRLVPKLRTINNAFFAQVSARSFTHAMQFLEQLIAGSERVMLHIAKHA